MQNLSDVTTLRDSADLLDELATAIEDQLGDGHADTRAARVRAEQLRNWADDIVFSASQD